MRAFKAAIIAVQMMLITAASGSPALAQSPPAPAPALRVIGFLSDFDVKDDAVGLCKAVMEGVAPGVKVIDITHQITPYDIAQGARVLAGAAPFFPESSIIVVVVDPGVGSVRKAIIAKARSGRLFVLPDNGLLTLFKGTDDIVEARQITNPAWMIGSKMSSTFHGRDIFSPVAAHLARGDDWTTAGPALDVTKLASLDIHNAVLTPTGLEAEVIGTDGPYGNLVLNLPAETFARLGYGKGDKVPFTLDGKAYVMPFVSTFSDVPEGQNLLYIDSRGRLSIGINMGNFSDTYRIGAGAKLVIAKK